MTSPKLYLIAAACKNMGIGYKGDLPWRLKKEMNYFTKITTTTTSPGKENVIIMGRSTWFSIPKSIRPLPNRINIVLSRTLGEVPEKAHYLAKSLEDAINLVQSKELSSRVDKIFIIGGEAVYKEAMESPHCYEIYLTRIDAEFECDTFFPEVDTEKFKLVTHPEVPNEIQEENNLQYKYELYQRIE